MTNDFSQETEEITERIGGGYVNMQPQMRVIQVPVKGGLDQTEGARGKKWIFPQLLPR